jgi:hypothetical protein
MSANRVLFDGTDASGNPGLWETHGTASGTAEFSVAGADGRSSRF